MLENDFISNLARIRPKILQQLCCLYFYTYVTPDRRLTEAHTRTPRIMPGLQAITKLLKCTEGKALDLLWTIQIMRKFLVKNWGRVETDNELQTIIRKEGFEKLLAMSLFRYGISSVPSNSEFYLSILIKALNYAQSPLADKESKKHEVAKKIEELRNHIFKGIDTDFKQVPDTHLALGRFQVIARRKDWSKDNEPKDVRVSTITSEMGRNYEKVLSNRRSLQTKLDPVIFNFINERHELAAQTRNHTKEDATA